MSGFANLELSALGSYGFRIVQSGGGRNGLAVSTAGDINGDGIGDVVLTDPIATFNSASTGDAWVTFGQAGTSVSDLNLDTLTASQGFRIAGFSSSVFGSSVSAAGDVDGDGIDDLIAGSAAEGPAWVIYGRTTGFSTIDLSTANSSQATALPPFRGRSSRAPVT